MSPFDLLRMAGTALVDHRLRSLLSLLGVAIGVCSVVLLTALGEGARRYVVQQFASLGTNLLIVIPGRVETTGALPGIGGAPRDLTLDDARVLARTVPGIADIAPIASGEETVAHGSRSRSTPIMGSTDALARVRDLELEEGSFLPAGDMDRGKPVAVVGRTVAAELFPGESPVGRVIRIGDWRMRVIGVMRSKGVQLGVDMDDTVLVPVSTAMRLFDRSSLFRIIIEVRAHADITSARERVIDILAERHDEEDVTVLTQDAVVESLTQILGALTAALAGIGAISLTVAGIGIMNVMLVTVSERTFEIGLLQAVGARRRQILSLFLVESILLSLAGGALGVGGAFAIVTTVGQVMPDFPVGAPAWAVALALGVSIGVGVLFGFLPASKASRLEPIAALAGS